jgi:hypothetical protein
MVDFAFDTVSERFKPDSLGLRDHEENETLWYRGSTVKSKSALSSLQLAFAVSSLQEAW